MNRARNFYYFQPWGALPSDLQSASHLPDWGTWRDSLICLNAGSDPLAGFNLALPSSHNFSQCAMAHLCAMNGLQVHSGSLVCYLLVGSLENASPPQCSLSDVRKFMECFDHFSTLSVCLEMKKVKNCCPIIINVVLHLH